MLLPSTDAVKIQNCPPQGCTEVDINWEYKPVCPDVDHLYLTLGDVFNTTTDLSVTGVTIKELDLNTKYRTCLHAFDVDDTLLARHCTNCRSQPEVVDKLSVTNVTDTTAVIDWEPPICPTADEIEYNVSYSKSGNKRSYITTDSKFQWTELKPAQNHNLCVTVLHNGITSADPACVDAFTLPECTDFESETLPKRRAIAASTSSLEGGIFAGSCLFAFTSRQGAN
ncbi:hypothetical protein E2C01_021404 [Portunus trituberculatus]|uniref:Fibronectin type-III domain-containing protein n=1 Tax=Portunus trituberculatus TaxID=210409 RepID=A0A5B7E4D8_PORTR|nr:hypothetical protein [Portunus trituberculatus]